MSVNIAKNKDSLVAAWRNVVDDKLPINWALFGYEGQTNNLKVVGSGDGGLEEMIEELNTSQVMYAFCRVIDTKTSLPKCLLINWQGEGAPIVRKGTCANHIRDIEKLLKGAHITLNARSEEEVEVELIMEKLARATGSAYKFNEPRGENGGQLGPVGTTYRRVIPEQEINATERDQFWQREEIEEKQRLEQERVRWEEERQRVEREIRSREEKESQLREKQVSAKETIVAKQRQAEQRAEEIKNLRNQPTLPETRNVDSDEERKSRSEELRKQRSKETQQLIAQRTINARAVFEQNSAAGQMRAPINQQQKSVPKSNHVEAARKVIEQQSQEVSAPKVQPEVIAMAQPKAEEPPQVHAVPDSAIVTAAPIQVDEEKAHTQPQQQQPQPQQQESEQTSTTNVEETENELYSQLEGGPYLYFDPNNEGMKARALYDYQAADDTEITFDPGDIITHIDAIDEGWWQGLGPDGTYGLFPANYVEVIEFHNA